MIKSWKRVGQTPLELLEEIRQSNPALLNEKMSYAGRLDPMAEGEMLILVGEDENQRRTEYLGFDKEYEAEILLGFTTDSQDLLGLVVDSIELDRVENLEMSKLKKLLPEISNQMLGSRRQKYPVFSSKNVSGRPLFDWFKAGQINQIKIPDRSINVKKVSFVDIKEISSSKLMSYINEHVNFVKGDFRQSEILDKWESVLGDNSFDNYHFPIVRMTFVVSSGTYIRSLAEDLGKLLDVPACLFSLKRTKIFNN